MVDIYVMIMNCINNTEVVVFFFKQKTAYDMRISDWSSDVCSSDLAWRKMREALELPDNIVPKTIRHTVATQLRTRGEPQEQISTLLGHAYANRTTGAYAKYDPEYLKRAAESLTMLWQDISAAADL